MNRKLIGILVMTLFLVTTTLPLVIGNKENVHKNNEEGSNLYTFFDGENQIYV